MTVLAELKTRGILNTTASLVWTLHNIMILKDVVSFHTTKCPIKCIPRAKHFVDPTTISFCIAETINDSITAHVVAMLLGIVTDMTFGASWSLNLATQTFLLKSMVQSKIEGVGF